MDKSREKQGVGNGVDREFPRILAPVRAHARVIGRIKPLESVAALRWSVESWQKKPFRWRSAFPWWEVLPA